MKKYFYLAVAAVAALASCSSDEEVAVQNDKNIGNDAVAFSVYTPSVTRSTIETLETVQKGGFGVFAFSQMQEPISSFSKANFQPNFMYNQQVTFDGSGWTYSPIKYWPNNEGALVSFYAYAPYFKEFNEDKYTFTPESNDYSQENEVLPEKNVRLILGYDAMGPAIEYTRSSVATEGVDLLWGKLEDGTVTTAPVDLKKQAINDKVKFQFKHAMSRLFFNVQVWGDEYSVNEKDQANSKFTIDKNTTIQIKKVELVGNFWNKGTLRLYDGNWKHEKGDVSNLVFEGDNFSEAVKKGITQEEAAQEIDLLVGNGMKDGQMLDDNVIDNFVMVMPDTKFYIQITYDVITVDPSGNDKNNSTVTNVIKSTDKNAVAENSPENDGYYTLEQGKAYNFHLNLGMTSVKFDASVDDWGFETDEVALPENIK